jgi:ribosomal protein L44E
MITVNCMAYCHNCGEKLPDNAFFCPKCGTKTVAGVQSGASSPADDMRDALMRNERRNGESFTIAAKEVQKPSNKPKTTSKKPSSRIRHLPQLGEKNPPHPRTALNAAKTSDLKPQRHRQEQHNPFLFFPSISQFSFSSSSIIGFRVGSRILAVFHKMSTLVSG